MSGTLRKMRRLALAQHREAISPDDLARLRSWAERHDARLGPGQHWRRSESLLAVSVQQLLDVALRAAASRPNGDSFELLRARRCGRTMLAHGAVETAMAVQAFVALDFEGGAMHAAAAAQAYAASSRLLSDRAQPRSQDYEVEP